MEETRITLSWLGAYALAGVLGFFGGKAIDQILAVVLKRRLMGMGSSKKRNVVTRNKDIEEQRDLIKNMAENNKFKPSHCDMSKELKRQRIANQ